MYTELSKLINSIQRNKITESDIPTVCKAVQEYYKQLNAINAINISKKKG